MPFEDLLVTMSKCKTCDFISTLEPELRDEVRGAMAKAKYGNSTLADGLRQVSTDDNEHLVPSKDSVDRHRKARHA